MRAREPPLRYPTSNLGISPFLTPANINKIKRSLGLSKASDKVFKDAGIPVQTAVPRHRGAQSLDVGHHLGNNLSLLGKLKTLCGDGVPEESSCLLSALGSLVDPLLLKLRSTRSARYIDRGLQGYLSQEDRRRQSRQGHKD